MTKSKKESNGQLQLPLRYNYKKNNTEKFSDGSKKTAEHYVKGECHCSCAGCDSGYHCHKKGRGCGM